MSGLPTEPYKGTRDFYPEDMRVRNYIFGKWLNVVRRFGYEAYDAPLLEPVDIYEAKSGQELVSEQTYQFTDRGDRKVAIRPELTPSVSRMVARRRQELPYPTRWYNIGQFMRYERPQRGREREFWQLNVDIFGTDDIRAEAEIINLGSAILAEFGATPDMYTIRVNNRKVINSMMANFLELDAIQAQLMTKLFDRKGKISNESFRDQAIEIFGPQRARQGLRKISQLLAAKSMADLPEVIRDSQAVKDVQKLFTLLEKAGIRNAVFDITLMRGLDYYTGTVFEFFDNHPENRRALFGGGRYDGLVGVFGVEPISAVGIAPGYTMTELFLQVHNLIPKLSSTTDLYVAILPGVESEIDELVAGLRKEGVNVEVDFTKRKIDKQLKTALKKGIRYMLFVGEDEIKDKQYTLKDLRENQEEKVSLERIVSTVKDHRKNAHGQDEDLFVVEVVD
ncbi:histidine--tRNA ligase [Candidatus Saccharibacteria bacterium]|nr:MAG: histidine--tRNA ligase [Candidatus Saccharibacteria bacterium]